ncbi:Mov34/MPN/PAD-1 family protein [Lignipirellula cremea]|uniref:Mov34/MPN/PAD-1 family protein n=1 Tax=Lignipirellula cremea TaxID=2528010 RepID=UPI001E43E33E|nr:Mov34/MPN/PAD-1 family protein [Lignipirellula cremea]
MAKQPQRRRRAPTSALRFSPFAWAQLLYLRDQGETEVGGFGVTAEDNLLRVEEIVLVRQVCTATSVKFDDMAVADFFDQQVDAGRQPQQFGRIWLHTHPGDSAQPSWTDEQTFARCFGQADWAVMFILAQGGETYARLQFNQGPGGSLLLPVETDFTRPFAGSDEAAWRQQYVDNVVDETAQLPRQRHDRDLWRDGFFEDLPFHFEEDKPDDF